MNATSIETILSHDTSAAPNFRRVFAMDHMIHKLPTVEDIDGIYIFNTQPSLKPWAHWVCVIIINEVGYYFDSFGRHPRMILHVSTALANRCRIIYWNDCLLQNTTSTLYVVMFIV